MALLRLFVIGKPISNGLRRRFITDTFISSGPILSLDRVLDLANHDCLRITRPSAHPYSGQSRSSERAAEAVLWKSLVADGQLAHQEMRPLAGNDLFPMTA